MLGRPGTGSFLVTRYLSSAPSVCLLPVRYGERKLWGIISLSQHVLLIIITFALHIAWHPERMSSAFCITAVQLLITTLFTTNANTWAITENYRKTCFIF